MSTAQGQALRCQDCEQCFYCRHYLPTRHEHDHFPVPRLNDLRRGVRWRPACLNCHDLKDRLLLRDWPAPLWGDAWKYVAQLEPQRLLWRLTMHTHNTAVDAAGVFVELKEGFCQGLADEAEQAVEELPYPGSLLVAKIVATSFAVQDAQRATNPHAHECKAA